MVVEEKEAWETLARVWATLAWRCPVAVLAAFVRTAGGAAGPSPARCARTANASLPLYPHLPAMPGLFEFIVLSLTLVVSLVVSLAITVPLTGALVRLRGKELRQRSQVMARADVALVSELQPEGPSARSRGQCQCSHWSYCHVVLRNAEEGIPHRGTSPCLPEVRMYN